MYIYHMRVYFKIKSHEFSPPGFVLMDCNVCPAPKSGDSLPIAPGIAFEISSETLFQNGLILPASSKVLVPKCRQVSLDLPKRDSHHE